MKKTNDEQQADYQWTHQLMIYEPTNLPNQIFLDMHVLLKDAEQFLKKIKSTD